MQVIDIKLFVLELESIPLGLEVGNGKVGIDLSDDFDQLIDIAFEGLNIGANEVDGVIDFMGDTGSLALGGALGAIAVAAHHEIVLLIVGGLFVLETASVMIQVFWFKRTGKRVFRMAPIHHHFEQLGWPESTVVVRFWIISIVLAVIGLSTLKLR